MSAFRLQARERTLEASMSQILLQNPGKVINKLNFNGIFQNAWLNSITSANIAAGFRKTGVYPFNQDAITCTEGQNDEGPTTQGN